MKALIVIGPEFINHPEVQTTKELYDFLEMDLYFTQILMIGIL